MLPEHVFIPGGRTFENCRFAGSHTTRNVLPPLYCPDHGPECRPGSAVISEEGPAGSHTMSAPGGAAVAWYESGVFAITYDYVATTTQHRAAALSYLMQLKSLSPESPNRPELQQRAENKLQLLSHTWDLIYKSLIGNIP